MGDINSTNNTPSKGPLEGIRILDLSAVVSGPMAAVILADQGADVIKIEPVGWGDGVRRLGASRNGLSAIYAMINRNKRSVAINIKHPEGQNLIRQLAENSDVLLQNYRPGKMKQLGLGYAELSQINPELIYTSISGMGDKGPYADQKVYDYVIQGISGILDAQSETQKPKMIRSIIYDKVTALTIAQGITAALLAKARGQGGQHLQLAMLDAALYFNWPDLMWNQSFEGEGIDYSGDLADFYEINETRDGAIISHRLNGDCSAYSTEELITLFAENDVPVSRVNSREDILDDPQIQALGLLERSDHPRGGIMIQPRAPVRFSKTQRANQQPSAELGQHTLEVLTDLGLEIDELRNLAAQGVIG
jgi:crotonobetainyl-CoA:carnitine CoA-transferase CaiB-like acyl-CoA transferase